MAYRSANPVYLGPYPDTVPTLLKLRDQGYKLGAASGGKSVKQWKKRISLGLQHMFDSVVISQDLGLEQLTESVIKQAVGQLRAHANSTVFVGVQPEKEIDVANRAGLISVRLRRGSSMLDNKGKSSPKYEISKISELIELLAKL